MTRVSAYMPDLAEVSVILAAIPQHWSVGSSSQSRFRNAAHAFFGYRDRVIVGV